MMCAWWRCTRSVTSSASAIPRIRPTSCTPPPGCATSRSATSPRPCCCIGSRPARSAEPRRPSSYIEGTQPADHMTYRGIVSFLAHQAPDGGAATLAQALDARTRDGELVQPLPDKAVRCVACGHRCLVKPGRRGICKVRFNQDGTLYVPAGYVAALQCDPTEKKPFFHALPGSDTLTFGMLGCDFHCGYCQNWLTSQALRDDAAGVVPSDATPDDLVRLALRQGAKLVGSSYNEPL